MKKLLVTILILTLTMSLFVFIPTMVMAETPSTNEDINRIDEFDISSLNTPIYDGVDYYINIKNPSIFATYDNILAVVQGDDVVVKISSDIIVLEGAAYYKEGDKKFPVKSISIIRKNINNGYIFFTYNNKPSYKTVIYSYYDSHTAEKASVTPYGDFAKFITDNNLVSLDENETIDQIKDILNTTASHISTVYINGKCIIYVVANTGDVYKITSEAISKLPDIDASSKGLIYSSPIFTVNEEEDIYVYGGNDLETKLHKRLHGQKNFDEVATLENVVDIIAHGEYLYVLTRDALSLYSNSMMTHEDSASPKTPIYTTSFNDNDKDSISSRLKSFNITTNKDDTYISIAREGSDNISTYKQTIKDKKPVLVYDNHYGANCTCDTPHQGWFDRPTLIATNPSDSTIYVVDRDGKRLVIMKYDKDNKVYRQYFYGADKLLLDTISDIKVDRHNNIYLASANKVYVYSNNEQYNDEQALPLRRIQDIGDLDGNIIEMKMSNRSESELYILTDKHTVYKVAESDMRAVPIATFDENIISIAPSLDATRIYVATEHDVRSFPIEGININEPLTQLISTKHSFKEISVDYIGSIFVSTDEALLLRYRRTGDNSYVLDNMMRPSKAWSTLSDFHVNPQRKTLYFVDETLHTAEINDPNGWASLYKNDADKYNDKNDYTLKYVVKANAKIKVYKSPKNYEMYRYSEVGEYFYMLANDKNNKSMYLAVDRDNNFVYIKDEDITRIDASTSSVLGATMMPLFGTTNIYMYPFEKDVISEPVDHTTGTMTLIDNVAYDDGICWQNSTTKWLKVTYMSSANVPVSGYVKMNEVTRSTNPTAPATKIHLRVCTDGVETVSMYDAPDTASGILMRGIKNGTLVRLMQDEFDKDAEFTLVEIEDKDGGKIVGYILTSNLQENTFTTLQIVAIIVSVITVVITIIVIILIVELKKKKDSANSFREDDHSTRE